MRWLSSARRWQGAVLAVVVMALVSSSSALAAEGPVWRVTSVADPTHLQTAVDQVQEITVKGTEGVVAATFNGGLVSFPATATAASVQATLEEVAGPGNVEVTGGPGDATGTKPYVVTFTGRFAGVEVEQIGVVGSFANEVAESVTSKVARPAVSSGTLLVKAINVGGGSTDGSTITINDSLPAGLTAEAISGVDYYFSSLGENESEGGYTKLSCSLSPSLGCTDSNRVDPGDTLSMEITVAVQPGTPSGVGNQALVSGGGAELAASVASPVVISSSPASFGIDPASVVVATSTRQAGAHPDVTVAYTMNTRLLMQPVLEAKDTRIDFPQGLVGSAVGVPQCQVSKISGFGRNECPSDTIVGVATITTQRNGVVVSPVYNIQPSPGEPAAFAFPSGFVNTRLDTSVLSNGDYGVRVTAGDQSQIEPVLGASVTIWGVPADHQGPGATFVENSPVIGGPSSTSTRAALLTNPTQCSAPLSATLSVDPWVEQGDFRSVSAPLASMTGCGRLPFVASASMLPDTLQAGAPAGYTFDLHVQQSADPDGLATPNVRRVVATLPMGTVVSPSTAWGLQACSDEAFGLHTGLPAECPREAQVGTVQITTPALAQPFSGQVYLATPDCDPCTPDDAQGGRMVRLFMQAIAEGESGIIVKLEGQASVNQQTGQLSVTFDENPQLPFSDLKLTLGGGPRATLANPRTCGVASTTVDLTPWSSPFTPDVTPTSVFEPTGCYSPQFNPSFVAGTTSIQSGEYTPFTVSFGRSDADEFLNGLQLRMPPGLLGSLSNVPLCKEPQAAEGTCGQGSLIGHTQVLTGPGADPFLVTGGQVFLTEGYKGAPFGLSIVVPAVAGPYTLAGTTGKGTVVVRAAINIDPQTAALTITSDPLPTALDGIPLQLKVVNVTIDRPGFTFNPTNCSKLAIEATLSSKESAGATVSSPFQVTNCAGLGFKPRFTVSTSGRTSRVNGASLDAKVIYPLGPKLANIARVKVELPKRLPSRLTTLQKACPAATFAANPGDCPAASVVGIARANTPILPVTLTGPVYFVSHGGEAFPNLIVVLQGYGVRVDLVGSTFISKAGITSSTFEQVPDVPISSFELYLPEGPHSALAANGNLCTGALTMPTQFTAQNGAEIHQNTKINVTKCTQGKRGKAKAKKAARAKQKARSAREANRRTGRGRGKR
jgi:hypothetical protein